MKSLIVLFTFVKICLSSSWHSFNDVEFLIGPEKLQSYEEANQMCKTHSANLAAIKNEQIQNFLEGIIQQNNPIFPGKNYSTTSNKASCGFWIGLRYETQSNQSDFLWNDNTIANYTNWNGNEIDSIDTDGEHCVIFGFPSICKQNISNFNWFTVNCNNTGIIPNPRYICQRPKDDEFATTAIAEYTTFLTRLQSSETKLTNSQKSTETFEEPNNMSRMLLIYIIPSVIVLIIVVVILVIAVLFMKNTRPRSRSIGKVKIRAQSSANEGTLPHFAKPLDLNTVTFRSTNCIENPRDKDFYQTNDEIDDYININDVPYESVTSLECSSEKQVSKRPMYTKVKKMKNPSDKKSLEITDNDDSCYTTVADVRQDQEEDPYVTVPEMISMSDNTYSLRRCSHEINPFAQPASDLYDALAQNR